MNIEMIITLITLGVIALGGIVSVLVAIVRGEVKQFIIKAMEIAEKSGMDGSKKLQYVLNAVKEKYQLASIVINVRKFIEYIISISKNINSK